MNYDNPPHRSARRRHTWSQMFGRFLRHDRLKTGRSIEECARLAGMEADEWELMETGQLIPATKEKLQAMAMALDMAWANMVVIAFFCRSAWD